MGRWKKLEETKLPPKNEFYSKLNIKGISDEDSDHAEQVWNRITTESEDVTLRLSSSRCFTVGRTFEIRA